MKPLGGFLEVITQAVQVRRLDGDTLFQADVGGLSVFGSKKRQPASSSNLFILTRAAASLIGVLFLVRCN